MEPEKDPEHINYIEEVKLSTPYPNYYMSYKASYQGIGDFMRTMFVVYVHFHFDENGNKRTGNFEHYDFKYTSLDYCFTSTEGSLQKKNFTYIDPQVYYPYLKKYLPYTNNEKKAFTDHMSLYVQPILAKAVLKYLKFIDEYYIIHVRTGDQHSKISNPDIRLKDDIAEKRLKSFLEKKLRDDEGNLKKYVLITDSPTLTCEGTIKLNNGIHTAYNDKSKDSRLKVLDTVAQFFMLFKAKEIYQFVSEDSNRPSMFSLLPAYLGNVPFYSYDGISIKHHNNSDMEKLMNLC